MLALPPVCRRHHLDGHPLDGRLSRQGAVDARPLYRRRLAGFAAAVRERVASPLRTLANLLEAMREGDYSIRARGARYEDALGEVMQQVNAMGATLRAQRLGALEATTLLRKVMEEIDVAIFAFDSESKLKLVNRAGERLVGQPAERVVNLPASELGLGEFLEGEAHAPSSAPSGEPAAAGASAAANFAKAACRTNSSSSPTSRARCAKKNCRRGSASCACSATSSIIR